ncbi:biotin synthase BioB [Desulfobacterota bacterium AH_259_B03_O07]|nr:biotin synthase BioB [Desulfobacterota bacterium AH_259_B03_O07]
MSGEIIQFVRKKLLDNKESITFYEAHRLALLGEEYLLDLVSLSYKVTREYKGKGIQLCGIISAKTGNCPEDCAFCAQSIHSKAPIPISPIIDPPLILKSAKEAEKSGASEFCIVTSGNGPDKKTFRKVLDAVDLIHSYTNLSVGCSLGILTEEQAKLLSKAGVKRYNHNLETSRSFFPRICTTHTYEERVETAYLVKENEMELCSGAILGMGESLKQRVELAFELRELDPTLVPINFLNPRPGTALARKSPLTPIEAIKSIALFRLILPRSILICAGGREVVLRDLQPLALLAGANGLITGNYLTTPGRLPKEDLQMITDLNMSVVKHISSS